MAARIAIATAVLSLALAPAAGAQGAATACRDAAAPGTFCVGGEKLAERAAAECRRAGVASDEQCAPPFGVTVIGAAVDDYGSSWVHRALGLQYELAADLGLANAPWIGTHNSYNSTAELPTLSQTDSNQQLSLTDQLRLDVRSLELDVHWFPSARTGGFAPVLCHATGEHAGCSTERLLRDGLAEIRAWLDDNADQVLLLYLEDHVHAAGHDAVAADLEAAFGDLLYRPDPPADGGCAPMPLDLTRGDVRDAGARVVVVSGCGTGAWRGAVFDWSATHVETGGYDGYGDDCAPAQFSRATYDSTMVRYFEDSTWVSATTAFPRPARNGITPAIAASMARCGVDLLGLDQILPDDGRLEALVWSWAPDEPAAAGDCSVKRADGRWAATGCAGPRRAACRAADGSWSLSAAAVAYADAAAACTAAGGALAVPRTGRENELLKTARSGATDPVWLGQQRQADGSWLPADPR